MWLLLFIQNNNNNNNELDHQLYFFSFMSFLITICFLTNFKENTVKQKLKKKQIEMKINKRMANINKRRRKRKRRRRLERHRIFILFEATKVEDATNIKKIFFLDVFFFLLLNETHFRQRQSMSNYTKTEFGSKMLNVNIYALLNEINNKTTKNKRCESVE